MTSLFFSSIPYKPHRVYMKVLVVGLTLATAGAAQAQSASGPTPADQPVSPADSAPAIPPPETPPAPVPPAVDAAALAALSAKVDEADQTARIAARKIELARGAAGQQGQGRPERDRGQTGFGIRSADGAYQLRFRGQLQADSRWFLGDTNLSDRLDTFLLRRFRPGFDGTRSISWTFVSPPTSRAARWWSSTPTPTSTQCPTCACAPASSRRRSGSSACRATRTCRSSNARYPVPDTHTRRRPRAVGRHRGRRRQLQHRHLQRWLRQLQPRRRLQPRQGRRRPAADPAIQGAGSAGAGLPGPAHRGQPRRPARAADGSPARLIQERRAEHVLQLPRARQRSRRIEDRVRVPDPEAAQPGHLLLLRTAWRS